MRSVAVRQARPGEVRRVTAPKSVIVTPEFPSLRVQLRFSLPAEEAGRYPSPTRAPPRGPRRSFTARFAPSLPRHVTSSALTSHSSPVPQTAAPLVSRWRVLVTPPADGAWNMALDEALLARARETGEGVVRVYGWSAPTLSLGRHQTARGRYDLERASALGVRFVRRPTGGRAVLHHREVTYSVTAPVGPMGSLRESYGWINRLLVEGLHRLGVDAQVAASVGHAPPPGTAPCFEEPVDGEIVARGRKLVGSAQVREDGALLQHGSILLEDDQELASALLVRPVPAPPAPATLCDLLGRAPSLDEVAGALATGLTGAVPFEGDGALLAATHTLRERYEDPGWTWRR